MSGQVTWLPPIKPAPPPEEWVRRGASHPMRMVTRAAAAEVGAWAGDTPASVEALFDDLAGEWHTRHSPDRLAVVHDALDRGRPIPAHGTWLELGSGDGGATPAIGEHAPALIACDVSAKMLTVAARASATPLLRADASRMPLSDNAISAVVLMNMLLFPTEMDRILAPGGVLLWINSRAEATPIHLMPEEVVAAMPGRWCAVAARHGPALWSVLRRVG